MKLNFFDSESFAQMVESYKHSVTWGSTCRENEDDPDSMTEMDTLYGPDDFSDAAHAVAAGEVMAFCVKFPEIVGPACDQDRYSLAHTLALSQIGHGVTFADSPINSITRAMCEPMDAYARNGTLTSDAEWYIGDGKEVYLFGHEWMRHCDVKFKVTQQQTGGIATLSANISQRVDAYSAGHALYLATKHMFHTGDTLSVESLVDHSLDGMVK